MTLKMASSSGEQLPGQVVLVLQGGGALGAYQVGVYQALHEAGVEPDWVIGTSIGAVNGALIAGNETEKRLPRLHEFWDKVRLGAWVEPMAGPWANHWYANLSTYIGGIPGFFMPRAIPWGGMYAPLGVYSSSWYRTEPLHATLTPLIDFELLKAKHTRLTVGAVNVKSGELRYFDNTRAPEPLALEHVMASGALPPAFPAIAVDGEPYWDGGIYSNTPIEAVLDDHPRRDSVIFSVNVWQPAGPEPQSIWDVLGRQKNIQYASRAGAPQADPPPAPHHPQALASPARGEARPPRRQGPCRSRLRHHHAYRALPRARARGRRLQQGHRLHAHRHHRALRGRLRRHAEDARAQALGEAGRPDGRRDHPSGRAAERTARTQLN